MIDQTVRNARKDRKLQRRRVAPVMLAAIIMAAASFVEVDGAFAQAPDAAAIATGSRLYQQKGDCQACHGWAGDGRKIDAQMPDGANLRESAMNRELLILTIKCGRPGTGMPAFDRLAYSDGRCFGLKQADLRARKLDLPDPPATLQPNEIELLADFMLLKIVGQGPMDRVKCIDYWGSEVEACNEFPR